MHTVAQCTRFGDFFGDSLLVFMLFVYLSCTFGAFLDATLLASLPWLEVGHPHRWGLEVHSAPPVGVVCKKNCARSSFPGVGDLCVYLCTLVDIWGKLFFSFNKKAPSTGKRVHGYTEKV